LLGLVEVFLLARKPLSIGKWKEFSASREGRSSSLAEPNTISWAIDQLLDIGSFDVAKRVRRREEEHKNGID